MTAAANGIVDGTLIQPLRQTITSFAAGLGAAIAIGVPVGMAMGRSRFADEALSMTVDALRPIPAVALVPVAVVVLGLGLRMQVALIAFAAVWPIVFNTRYGAHNVDATMTDAARLSGLSRPATMVRVVLPASMPSIMTGFRLAAAVAVVLTIVTEMVASGTGIGYFVDTRLQVGESAQALAGVLLAALLGWMVNITMLKIENHVIGWHLQQQGVER